MGDPSDEEYSNESFEEYDDDSFEDYDADGADLASPTPKKPHKPHSQHQAPTSASVLVSAQQHIRPARPEGVAPLEDALSPRSKDATVLAAIAEENRRAKALKQQQAAGLFPDPTSPTARAAAPDPTASTAPRLALPSAAQVRRIETTLEAAAGVVPPHVVRYQALTRQHGVTLTSRALPELFGMEPISLAELKRLGRGRFAQSRDRIMMTGLAEALEAGAQTEVIETSENGTQFDGEMGVTPEERDAARRAERAREGRRRRLGVPHGGHPDDEAEAGFGLQNENASLQIAEAVRMRLAVFIPEATTIMCRLLEECAAAGEEQARRRRRGGGGDHGRKGQLPEEEGRGPLPLPLPEPEGPGLPSTSAPLGTSERALTAPFLAGRPVVGAAGAIRLGRSFLAVAYQRPSGSSSAMMTSTSTSTSNTKARATEAATKDRGVVVLWSRAMAKGSRTSTTTTASSAWQLHRTLVCEGEPRSVCWAGATGRDVHLVVVGLAEGGLCVLDLREDPVRVQAGGVLRPTFTTEAVMPPPHAAPVVAVHTAPAASDDDYHHDLDNHVNNKENHVSSTSTSTSRALCRVLSADEDGRVTQWVVRESRGLGDHHQGQKRYGLVRLEDQLRRIPLGRDAIYRRAEGGGTSGAGGPTAAAAEKRNEKTSTKTKKKGNRIKTGSLFLSSRDHVMGDLAGVGVVRDLVLDWAAGSGRAWEGSFLVASSTGRVLRGRALGTDPYPKEYTSLERWTAIKLGQPELSAVACVSLAPHPIMPGIFAALFSDGSVAIYDAAQATPRVRFPPPHSTTTTDTAGGLGPRSDRFDLDVEPARRLHVVWSPHYPAVLYVVGLDGWIRTYDLIVDKYRVVRSVSVREDRAGGVGGGGGEAAIVTWLGMHGADLVVGFSHGTTRLLTLPRLTERRGTPADETKELRVELGRISGAQLSA